MKIKGDTKMKFYYLPVYSVVTKIDNKIFTQFKIIADDIDQALKINDQLIRNKLKMPLWLYHSHRPEFYKINHYNCSNPKGQLSLIITPFCGPGVRLVYKKSKKGKKYVAACKIFKQDNPFIFKQL
uniref:Uncharacterized protein n=1 Tax=candidate division WOR-3 bacterium TaxID=2052148 RepID=A0A7C6EAE2_UNCW3